MADAKISALPAALSLSNTDELLVASGGANKKLTGATLKASVRGGGPGTFHGAELFLSPAASGHEFVPGSPFLDPVPFDRVQVDSDSLADLANGQIVIPAGLSGVWHYGYEFDFTTYPTDRVLMRASLVVNGSAWNIDASADAQGHATLGGSAIDLFEEGDSLYMLLTSEPITMIAPGSSTRHRMWAYYLGQA